MITAAGLGALFAVVAAPAPTTLNIQAVESRIHALVDGSARTIVPGEPATACRIADMTEAFDLLRALPDARRSALLRLFAAPAGPDCLTSAIYPIRSCYDAPAQLSSAQEILHYAETAWQMQVDELGFWPPKRLGPSGAEIGMDFHIGDAGAGASAYTSPSDYDYTTAYTDCASFIVIGTVALGSDHLEGTVAHELNHASQMAMDCAESATAMEATSTWVVPATHAPYDAYFHGSIIEFQNHPSRSLGYWEESSSYQYGVALFIQFLQEFLGGDDPAAIVALWEATVQNAFINEPDLLDAVGDVAQAQGLSLADVTAAFGEWRYFVGSRDDGRHFGIGSEWFGAEVQLESTYTVTGWRSFPLYQVSAVHQLGYSYTVLNVGAGTFPTGRLQIVAQGQLQSDWIFDVWVMAEGLIVERFGAETSHGESVVIDIDHTHLANGDQVVVVTHNLGAPADWDDTWVEQQVSLRLEYAARPTVESVTPGEIRLGAETAVTISGDYFTSGTAVGLIGDGVTLVETTYIDVNTIEVVLSSSPEATPGPRGIVLDAGSADEVVRLGAFDLVLPELPRVDTFTPVSAQPGETLLFRIEGSFPTAAISTAFACDAVAVTQVRSVTDGSIYLDVEVAATAGAQSCALTVTDRFGRTVRAAQMFAVEIDAAEESVPVGGCAGVAAPRGWAQLGVLIALYWCVRRRRPLGRRCAA